MENNIEKTIDDFTKKLEASAPPKGKAKKPVAKKEAEGKPGPPEGVAQPPKNPSGGVPIKAPLNYYDSLSLKYQKQLKEAIQHKVFAGKSKQVIEAEICDEFNIHLTANWQDIVDMVNELSKKVGPADEFHSGVTKEFEKLGEILAKGTLDLAIIDYIKAASPTLNDKEVMVGFLMHFPFLTESDDLKKLIKENHPKVTNLPQPSDLAIINYIKTLPKVLGLDAFDIGEKVIKHFPVLVGVKLNMLIQTAKEELKEPSDQAITKYICTCGDVFDSQEAYDAHQEMVHLVLSETKDYGNFLSKLSDIVSVLAETIDSPVPDKPILIVKDVKGDYHLKIIMGDIIVKAGPTNDSIEFDYDLVKGTEGELVPVSKLEPLDFEKTLTLPGPPLGKIPIIQPQVIELKISLAEETLEGLKDIVAILYNLPKKAKAKKKKTKGKK